MVDESNALPQILAILNKGVSLGDAEGAALLRSTAAGCLLNFLDEQSALQQKV